MTKSRAACLFAFPALLLLAGAILGAGHALSKSANHAVAPSHPGGFLRVEIPGAPGRTTRGFYAEAPGEKAFILAHGNSSDGSSMLPRARWLLSQGYSVVIPDLQAHGETPGERKTFGWREAEDVAAAYRYLASQRGKTWIGGIGSSLGGASMLKAAASGTRFHALVLESVYADIRTAVRNRLELRMGEAGRHLEPLLTGQVPLWCGVSRNELQPAAWAKEVDCPALVLVGASDRLAKPWESEAIFANLRSTRKMMRKVEGAGHVDLFAYDLGLYAGVLKEFLPSPAMARTDDIPVVSSGK